MGPKLRRGVEPARRMYQIMKPMAACSIIGFARTHWLW